MELILERENWDLQKIKDYISDFKTTEEFHKSPKARAIISWLSKHRGPNGEKLYIKDFLSGLEKKGPRRKSDDEVTDQLKQQFPQWNFDNVTYRFPEKPDGTQLGRYLDGLYCPIKDENGIPHGVSDNINVRDLKKRGNGCRECGKKRTIDSLKLDFSQWIEDFPKDKDYIFNIKNFYYRTEGLKNKTAFVKDVICAKHNPSVVFAKNGVNIHNLRNGKTGCPVCGKSESKGEKKVREELERLGYDVSKQKTFPGCFGFGGTRYCDLLKFDAYIIKKDGTEVCIEYDGIQHYEPQPNWGGEEGLKSTQERDKLKTEYCEKNNIKLIRIPYWEIDNIGKILEDELGDSSDDIMRPNLTKEYIVTESQLKRIVEQTSDFMTKLRRRFNKKTMQDFIYHAETEFPKLCEQFDNKFEYADAVINKAIDDFIFQEEFEQYVYSGDWNFYEQIDLITMICKDWFEDGLLGHYQITCQDEYDDEDFDMMNEAVNTDLEPNKVIVKLFKFLNTQKTNYNNKRDLQSSIKNYLPYFGIEPDFAPYILELYLLNYREDGDYSSLTKDNFIDPRKMKGKRTPNYNAKIYTIAQLPFEGSNLRGYWRTTMDGKIYIVESYGWYPVYIFKDGKWYETSDRYSSSTGKHMNASRPYRWNDTLESQVYLLSRQEMEMIERGATHEKVMELKRKAFRDMVPSLVSQKVSTAKSSSYGVEPKISIKFKISSVEDIDDKNVVNVDIQDVLKVVDGKQVPTPENYLKGEIPNLTPEKVEKQIEAKLRNNFQEYLGPKFSDKPEEENIVFRFNHLKK